MINQREIAHIRVRQREKEIVKALSQGTHKLRQEKRKENKSHNK